MQWIYWLLAVMLSGAAAYWVYRADKKRAVPYPWITSLLRAMVVFLTLVLVLIPAILVTKNNVEKPVIVFLQDNSTSAGIALGADSARYRQEAEGILAKLEPDYTVVRWGFGAGVQTDSPFQYTGAATDISGAIEQAREYYGMQNLGAVVLATDGRFNRGNNPLYMPPANQGVVYTIAIGDSAQQKDIKIARAYANKTASLNSSFEIRADVVAFGCDGYRNTLTLKEGDVVLEAEEIAIATGKYDRTVSYTIKAEKPGLHHYVLALPAAEGEQNTANNRKDIFVEVADEQKNILIASEAPHPDITAIKEALAGMSNYHLSVCTIDNFPERLEGYDLLILHGLPSLTRDITGKLAAAKKPMWFILTGRSAAPAINSLADITQISVTQSPPHEVQASFSTAFNSFILPRQIVTVTDKMPPLIISAGNVLTPPGNNSLFTQKTGAGVAQTPVWLLQQGNVPAAILAGEGIWRWRLYEFKNFNTHNVIDECIRQTVTFLTANNNEKPFGVSMPRTVWSDQEPVSMGAYLRNASQERINEPDVAIEITDSAGNKKQFSFERSGNAYTLNIGIWAGGVYTYRAFTRYNGKDYTASGSFAVASTPLELMEQGADYALLYGLAKRNGGDFFTTATMAGLYDSIRHNDQVKPIIQTHTDSVPFVDKKWFFFLILAIAICEWLLRKYWMAQ